MRAMQHKPNLEALYVFNFMLWGILLTDSVPLCVFLSRCMFNALAVYLVSLSC